MVEEGLKSRCVLKTFSNLRTNRYKAKINTFPTPVQTSSNAPAIEAIGVLF